MGPAFAEKVGHEFHRDPRAADDWLANRNLPINEIMRSLYWGTSAFVLSLFCFFACVSTIRAPGSWRRTFDIRHWLFGLDSSFRFRHSDFFRPIRLSTAAFTFAATSLPNSLRYHRSASPDSTC